THTFPPSFFLDTDRLAPLLRKSLESKEETPPKLLGQLGSNLLAILDRYLRNTHPWFPILSPKKLHEHATEFKEDLKPSVAFLFLSLKLVSSCRSEQTKDEASELYFLARDIHNNLEGASGISLCFLQGAIFIALYELGQGIFPAAYMTIGKVARLASLIGLSGTASPTKLFKEANTWTEREEERRAWWAVFILERIINVAPSGLHMATPDPSSATLLPISDSRWNRGEIGPSEALFTHGFSSAANVGPFARLCQASHVLSMVQRHRETRHTSTDKTAVLNEALQLHSTLVALDNHLAQQLDTAASSDSWSCATDLAICCSARMMLYDMYGCNSLDAAVLSTERVALETEMQSASLEGLIQLVSQRAVTLAAAVCSLYGDAVGAVSPLIIECLYTAACECKWFVQERMVPDMTGTLQTLKNALAIVDGRWGISGRCQEPRMLR
ncbi:hypothetical protein GQ53DRAFT_654844, partial [Thozetella sp. PMI_491]